MPDLELHCPTYFFLFFGFAWKKFYGDRLLSLKVINETITKMDKYLDAHFFRSLGFYTKKEGLDFVDTMPGIRKELATFQKNVNKAIGVHSDFLKEVFNAHDTEMRKFIQKLKLQRKEQAADRKVVKVEEDMQDMRTQLKQELLQQIQREHDAGVVKFNQELYPVCEALPNFEELFMKLIRLHYALSPEERHRISVLKVDVENAYRTLASAAKELSTLAQEKHI